ncbi:MAG: acetate kinase [Jatrophihabitantaceae bacterium]
MSTDVPPSVLVLNCGSSSVKFALVDPNTGRRQVSALAERVGSPDCEVRLSRDGQHQTSTPAGTSPHAVIEHLLDALTESERAGLVGVGHRVVHGGTRFAASAVIDDDVLSVLDGLIDLAPLHLPANLDGIRAAQAVLPDLGQVAVFDTAFHQSMSPAAYRYAVPADWYHEHQVRRYGFHGTSHRYVNARAAELLDSPVESLRMVTVHLGNGCSAAAIRDGRSVDTTMGLTPLEGLVMGTRSGDIDPAVLGYLAPRLGLDLAALINVLNTRSGLLGLSGISNDLRTIINAAQAGSADAELAIEVFCHRVAKAIAAMAATLGRLDAVVFTGGIGEHSAEVRHRVLAGLAVLGVHENPAANASHGKGSRGRISSANSVPVLVVPTDEELVIARDTVELTR